MFGDDDEDDDDDAGLFGGRSLKKTEKKKVIAVATDEGPPRFDDDGDDDSMDWLSNPAMIHTVLMYKLGILVKHLIILRPSPRRRPWPDFVQMV